MTAHDERTVCIPAAECLCICHGCRTGADGDRLQVRRCRSRPDHGQDSGADEAGLFAAAAQAAAAGAENSKNFVSKFGRAKSYGAQTIGTPDAGAMSMAYFFRGLAQDSSESN